LAQTEGKNLEKYFSCDLMNHPSLTQQEDVPSSCFPEWTTDSYVDVSWPINRYVMFGVSPKKFYLLWRFIV
jgi:hypothetical protein